MFRKQVLPKQTINYKGRKITFDDAYMQDLAKAFNANAFDTVKLFFDKGDGKHMEDPEQVRGTIRGLELANDGLDVIIDFDNEQAADLVRQHPDFGVSARIIEGLEHADGRTFPRAIKHVLGTFDPRATGMRPWQEVSMSEEVKDTVDLTDEDDVTTEPEGTEGTPDSQPNPNPTEPDSDDDTDDEDDVDDDDADDDEDDDNPEGEVKMSREAQAVIDTLSAADRENNDRIRSLELQLAAQRFESEAAEYVRDGVPPAIVELARPLLSLPAQPVIELSRDGKDESIDVGDTVRKMLSEMKGFVELSREMGHSFATVDDGKDQEDVVLEAWTKQSTL